MIQPHESWNIHDSTKIKAFMECARKYMFEYGFGWRTIRPNNHLDFGEAYHRAREIINVQGFSGDTLVEAENAFLEYYRPKFPSATDPLYEPKVPGTIIPMLVAYKKRYPDDEFELIYDEQGVPMTEIAGSVTIDEGKKLYFRLDALMKFTKSPYRKFVLEIKTASMGGETWGDQWVKDNQPSTYNHVLNMLFSAEDSEGVLVDGSIWMKKVTKEYPDGFQFRRKMIRRTAPQMNAWWWNTKHWINMIDFEFGRLNECSDKDKTLMAFPTRTINCHKFFGRPCDYYELCDTWSNPLQQYDPEEAPPGFKYEWWNPADREKTAKKVVHL